MRTFWCHEGVKELAVVSEDVSEESSLGFVSNHSHSHSFADVHGEELGDVAVESNRGTRTTQYFEELDLEAAATPPEEDEPDNSGFRKKMF